MVTNRQLTNGSGLKAFGKIPNAKGPNELRMVKVTNGSNGWKVTDLKDKLSAAQKTALKKKYHLDIDVSEDWYASLKVACELFDSARKQRKSILIFVHGFNNDVEDVITAAQEIESLHDVIVVPFTWPANGGGAISGTASYKSDKSDARVSAGALNRFIAKIQQYHLMLTRVQLDKLHEKAHKKHRDCHQKAESLYSALVERECATKISLLCHSMGNYVLKHTLSTSENSSSTLVFDNICLVAADTNNEDHSSWVGKLDVRKRIYVVINENDSALRASRIKPGKEQKARLGHYLKKLDGRNAHYIDVTNAAGLGSEHTYFKGDAAIANQELKLLFSEMFKGEPIDDRLSYHTDTNTYNF